MSGGIVTLGIFASANAGKTTLTEHLLKKSGLIAKVGRVDSGTTVTDSLDIERRRGITVQSSYVTFKMNGNIVQLIDTPGHFEFFNEVIRTLNILDAAVLIVSGVKGIESQTYAIWDLLRKKNIPVLFFINKLDEEGADYRKVYQALQDELTTQVFSFIDSSRGSGILEDIQLLSEDVIGKGSEVSSDHEKEIREKIRTCSLYPVFGGSALKNIGIDLLYHYMEKFLPFSEKKGDSGDFSGYVYMIRYGKSRDIYVKVISGALNIRDCVDHTLDDAGKVKSISKVAGNKRISVSRLNEGEIGIITGLNVKPGMLIGKKTEEEKIVPQISPLFKINLRNDSDEFVFKQAIQKLNEEEPELNVKYDGYHKSFQMDVMGNLQSEIIIALLKEKFNVSCSVTETKIIYKETPSRIGIGKASYTSNSGVILKIRPLRRGSGIQFKSNISVDVLPFKFQKQVERLVGKYICCGSKGWEMTDACVELEGGTWDHVASVSQHYNVAVPVALARAIQHSCTELLEPFMKYNIRINEDALDLILPEITKFQEMYSRLEKKNSFYFIQGRAFVTEMYELTGKINALTHGYNRISYELCGYEHNQKGKLERNFIENSPHNVHDFLSLQAASIAYLDRGLARF